MNQTMLRSERGSVMVLTLLGLIAVVSLTLAGLSGASSSLKVARNYQTGLQALLSAEAGTLHAHERISDNGVIHFEDDVVDRWDEVYGGNWRQMPGYPGFRWSATIAPDPDNPVEYAILTTIGEAPNESRRVVSARLKIDQVYSPGAIYLPNPAVEAAFNGNNFLVDGYDMNLDGTPNGTNAVPGITTRDPDAEDVVENDVNGGQADNIIGAGGSPSVEQSWGPTADRIQNELVPGILSQGGVVTDPNINGNDTFGTIASPQITHFTGDLHVTANGTMDGAGILIIDGGLRINGDLNFTGLIIVRGTTEITTVSGNAVILGALWTTDLDLQVAGSASVTYSTEALELANGIGASEILPKRADAVSWTES